MSTRLWTEPSEPHRPGTHRDQRVGDVDRHVRRVEPPPRPRRARIAGARLGSAHARMGSAWRCESKSSSRRGLAVSKATPGRAMTRDVAALLGIPPEQVLVTDDPARSYGSMPGQLIIVQDLDDPTALLRFIPEPGNNGTGGGAHLLLAPCPGCSEPDALHALPSLSVALPADLGRYPTNIATRQRAGVRAGGSSGGCCGPARSCARRRRRGRCGWRRARSRGPGSR